MSEKVIVGPKIAIFAKSEHADLEQFFFKKQYMKAFTDVLNIRGDIQYDTVINKQTSMH